MEKFNVIFCVLTYKNNLDLMEFIDSLMDKVDFTYKIIVVNNFADETSYKRIKQIALSNSCVFIESENRGYSHGNNLGIAYAKSNYIFNYLIVCNPDTEIKQFDFGCLQGQEECIIAPEIICINGKKQNPMYYKYMPINEKLIYIAFKNHSKLLLYFGIVINKIHRYINNLLMDYTKNKEMIVYACHGSCIVFGYRAIEKLYPVFDDNIFLFCEESDLAKHAWEKNVNIIYNREIIVLHKEDGSMKLSNSNLREIHRASYLYYFEKWNAVSK